MNESNFLEISNVKLIKIHRFGTKCEKNVFDYDSLKLD